MEKRRRINSYGYNVRLRVAFMPGYEDECIILGGSNPNVTFSEIVDSPDTVYCSYDQMKDYYSELYEARRRELLGNV